jgi:DNA invertase Pin-like site-specific DNA recombinase
MGLATDRRVYDSRNGVGKPGSQRAAQYVRMSTEHQKYSTENQSDAIRRYADRRGIEIVRTYSDGGKSGLNLDGRTALKRLISDVLSGEADFEIILVYDISRWGRFQDTDEAAHYEYICRQANIAVHYCAEQFENDGSIGSTIIKSVKRAMAGEYSRELSVKVFAGQSRLIKLGFRQGGPAGFGLRRMLVNDKGEPRSELPRGAHKSIQTDRVILIPGPDHEIEVVRRIFHMFVDVGQTEREIAAILNIEGLTTDLGRPWTRGTVHQILINEKYIGNNVWNHVSFKLKQKRVKNERDQWIRADGAFQGVVDQSTFCRAGAIVAERSRHFSDEEMLNGLVVLFRQHRYLSGLIIDEAENLPSSAAYRTRFGSLLRAYELVGFRPDRDYRYVEINRALRRMHPAIVADMITEVGRVGGSVDRNPITDLITINREFTISLIVARCQQTNGGNSRWHIRFDTGLKPDMTIAVRMDRANAAPLDYYLLPRIDILTRRLRLAEHNGILLDAYRFETLEPFFGMVKRAKLMEVA